MSEDSVVDILREWLREFKSLRRGVDANEDRQVLSALL